MSDLIFNECCDCGNRTDMIVEEIKVVSREENIEDLSAVFMWHFIHNEVKL